MQNKECRIIYLLSIIISVVFPFDYNISLESKYGEGSKASENPLTRPLDNTSSPSIPS